MLTNPRVRLLTTLTLAMVTATSTSHAQRVDARWQPWLGCWLPNANGRAPMPGSNEAPVTTLVCIVPGATPASVQVVNFTKGQVASRGVINPTGTPIARTQDDCTGTETAQWSADNRRVMLQSEFTCANNIKRHETGVLAMTPDGEWLQIQNVVVNGNSAVYVGKLHYSGMAVEDVVDGAIVERPMLDEQGNRIMPLRDGCAGAESSARSTDGRSVTISSEYDCAGLKRVAHARFERAADGAWVRTDKQLPPANSLTARLAVGADVTPDAVIEMTRHVDVATLQAWLTDRRQAFDLSGRQLVKLADAGVPPSVIDVLVALDHPDRFALSRGTTSDSARGDRTRGRGIDAVALDNDEYYYSRYGYDLGWNPYTFGYRYGNGCGSRYDRYNYDQYNCGYDNGLYGLGYPYDRRPIVVIPRNTSQPQGKAVAGSGYTRSGGGSSTRSDPPSGGSSTSSSSGRAATGSSTSSGSSGSSSTGSTGRTAKARGGN